MYLDGFPELAYPRMVRTRARGVPIRDGGRASAIAWMADGSLFAPDTIVRFDVAEGEKTPRRLADAFEQTKAGSIRFFGGDEIIRGALRGLELDLALDGAAFAFRRAPALEHRVVLRESTARDARALGEIDREHAVLFKHPKTLVAEIDHVAVGIVTRADIDRSWTEVRVAVHQPHRGYGFGASILATAADQLEAKEGRLICAGMHVVDERIRHTLERAGFRLVDYYFIGTRPR